MRLRTIRHKKEQNGSNKKKRVQDSLRIDESASVSESAARRQRASLGRGGLNSVVRGGEGVDPAGDEIPP